MAGNNNNIGGFTSGELKAAAWWVRNQQKLRRSTIGTLIGLSAAFWGYAVWGLLDAYAISYPRESRFNRDIALNQQLLAALQSDQPQNVATTDVAVTQGTDNRFDMAAEMTNPNEQWWVEFNYRFSLSGEQTPVRNGFVLPQSRQVLTELGYKPAQRGGRSASLIVDNVRWHRVDPSFVGASYKDFAANRMALDVEGVKYDTNILLGSRRVGQTSFMLNNRGAYGFWSVDLVIRLYRATTPVAITKINVRNLSPGEKRPINVTWLDNLPSIAKTEIIPSVNLLDPDAYLPTEYFK